MKKSVVKKPVVKKSVVKTRSVESVSLSPVVEAGVVRIDIVFFPWVRVSCGASCVGEWVVGLVCRLCSRRSIASSTS